MNKEIIEFYLGQDLVEELIKNHNGVFRSEIRLWFGEEALNYNDPRAGYEGISDWVWVQDNEIHVSISPHIPANHNSWSLLDPDVDLIRYEIRDFICSQNDGPKLD